MEGNKTKSGWKIAAIVLALLIAAAAAAVVGAFITTSAGSGSGKGEGGGEEAKIEQIQPSDDEIDVKSSILISADGSSSSQEAGAEGEDAGEMAEHRYEVVAQRMTWAEADAYCKDQGGYLAAVESQEEYDQLVQLANQSGRKVLFLGAQRGADGNFHWTNGDDLTFTAWMDGEPNNDGGSENCLVMFLVDGQWVWSDVPNDLSSYYGESSVGFICEWDS